MGERVWVLGVQGIKIINTRNVVFNQSEMSCLKSKIDKQDVAEKGTSLSEVN